MLPAAATAVRLANNPICLHAPGAGVNRCSVTLCKCHTSDTCVVVSTVSLHGCLQKLKNEHDAKIEGLPLGKVSGCASLWKLSKEL